MFWELEANPSDWAVSTFLRALFICAWSYAVGCLVSLALEWEG